MNTSILIIIFTHCKLIAVSDNTLSSFLGLSLILEIVSQYLEKVNNTYNSYIMNKFPILVILLILVSVLNVYSQDTNVLDQFAALDIQSGKQVISEDITLEVLTDESMGLLPEDSLNYKYVDKFFQKRMVRLDDEVVQKAFPETVTITPEGDLVLDYISLIPLLMEAIQEQQKMIAELESRLPELSEQTK